MAILTTNGPKPNSGEIKQILKFLKDVVTNKVYKAIKLLLYPCCDILITKTVITCNATNPGNYDVTLTLSKPFPIGGFLQFFVGGVITTFNEAIPGRFFILDKEYPTLTFTNVNIAPQTPGTHGLLLIAFYPVSADYSQGFGVLTPSVSILSITPADKVFPSC